MPSTRPAARVRARPPGGVRGWSGSARTLLLVLGLFAHGPALAADEGDRWWGRDKALHFSASVGIAAAGYGAASLATSDRRWRLVAGTLLGLAAGGAKEGWDATGAGDPSWRDFTWDVIGTATGLAVASLIDWLIEPGSSSR